MAEGRPYKSKCAEGCSQFGRPRQKIEPWSGQSESVPAPQPCPGSNSNTDWSQAGTLWSQVGTVQSETASGVRKSVHEGQRLLAANVEPFQRPVFSDDFGIPSAGYLTSLPPCNGLFAETTDRCTELPDNGTLLVTIGSGPLEIRVAENGFVPEKRTGLPIVPPHTRPHPLLKYSCHLGVASNLILDGCEEPIREMTTEEKHVKGLRDEIAKCRQIKRWRKAEARKQRRFDGKPSSTHHVPDFLGQSDDVNLRTSYEVDPELVAKYRSIEKVTLTGEDNICTICQYIIVEPDLGLLQCPSCKVIFHEQCAGSWLAKNKVCPNCRFLWPTL